VRTGGEERYGVRKNLDLVSISGKTETFLSVGF